MRGMLFISAAALLLGQQVTASQEILEEVRTVGARLSQPKEDVVGRVDIIKREDLLQDLTTNMSDLVRYIPGVSVVTADTRFGATGYTVRGLSGNRVTSLIDGVPIPDQFKVGAFSHSGQDFIIPDAISRVEILHGPASTLFGSDALAGVVAIITRDAEEYLKGRGVHIGASTNYSGRDHTFGATTSAAVQMGKTSALIHLAENQGQEIESSAGSSLDSLNRKRRSAMAKINLQWKPGHSFTLKAETFKDEVRSALRNVLGTGRRFRNTTSLTGDDISQRDNYQLAYQFETELGWLTRGSANAFWQDLSVTQNTDDIRSIATPAVDVHRTFNFSVRSQGINLDLESRLTWANTEHLFGWGFSYTNSEIDETRNGLQVDQATGITTNLVLGETMPVRDFPRSEITESAVYLYDEISIGNFSLIPGLRAEIYTLKAKIDQLFIDDNPNTPVVNTHKTSLAPKLGARWHVTSNKTLFAQYAHGFRAPPFEDVNIGFDIPRFNYRAIPNPKLKPETSDGLEIGIRSIGDFIRWEMAAFGAQYHDLIESRIALGRDDKGTLIFQSRNIDKAKVYGLEASMSADLDSLLHGLSLSVAFSWTTGINENNDQPLNTVDPAELITRLIWQPNEQWRVATTNTTVKRKSKVDNPQGNLFRPSGYSTTDITASFLPTKNTRIDLGIFNLFDKTYWRWASVRQRSADDPLINQLADPGRYVAVSARIEM